jgi:hypothetical protein
MNRIEQSFLVTALTGFFVFVGAMTWLMVAPN